MAYFRRTTAKGNTYLQLVESYRDQKGQTVKKVLASLGNISRLPEEKIDQLIKSFLRALGKEERYRQDRLTVGKGYHYGSCLPVIALWHQLGLDEIIGKHISKRVRIPVSKITLIQTANRFSDPGSKLACFRWFDRSLFSQWRHFIHFSDEQDEKLHTYYRSLDYLCSVKEDIEKELYYRFKGYGVENGLVLYDITSVYFEGENSEMGKLGFSRDHRPDCEQVVIGVVMNGDGVPIAHHIFEGNVADKSTVRMVLDDLQERFSIREVVFVGDRGMLTVENIEMLKRRGQHYIMGMFRRNRRITRHLLSRVDFTRRSFFIQEFGYEDLSEQLKKEYDPTVRFVVGYNPEVARKSKSTREKNIDRFKALVESAECEGELKKVQEGYHRLKSFLSQYHMSRFYTVNIKRVNGEDSDKDCYTITVQENSVVLKEEEKINGRYFIQTEIENKEYAKEEVVNAYKSLQKVERAFRLLKGEIEVRPMYVRKQTRIRGHVMICYLALLIEILLEKKLKEIFPEYRENEKMRDVLKKSRKDGNEPLTMMTLKEELETIRLIPLYQNDDPIPKYISTSIGNNVRKLFSSLGLVNATEPEKLKIKDSGNRNFTNQFEIVFAP